MKYRFLQSSLGVGSLVLLIAAMDTRPCGQSGSAIAPVPTLGGPGIQVNGLNAAGQMTGLSLTTNGEPHAFLFSNGSSLDLGVLDGANSQGVAINSLGHVAGDSDASNIEETHAFLYDGNSMIDLGTLGTAGGFSSATALNDADQVVGFYLDDNFLFKAFLYSGGTMVDIGDLGGGFSSAVAINNAGNIAGNALTGGGVQHAFFWTNGTMTDLGTLGGDSSSALAMNASDVVVGVAQLANGDQHGFVYANGVMTDVGSLGGDSSAHAVNNAGDVIGNSLGADQGFFFSAGTRLDLGTLGGSFSTAIGLNNLGQVVGESADIGENQRAFLWQNGTMVNLNSFLPANSGWVLTSAHFINDAGRVVGEGNFNGQFAVFVLDLGSDNNPPVAVAGADQLVECGSQVTLNGSLSSDPDNDLLTYLWTEGETVLGTEAVVATSLAVGTHLITLTVTDPCQESAQDTVVVQVVDNTRPVIVSATAVGPFSANAQCQATVPNVIPGIVVTDNCTPAGLLVITQNPTAGTSVGLGNHTILVTVTDASNNSTNGTLTFSVVDTTAPAIVSVPGPLTVSAGANCSASLPNVVADVVATDNCTLANQLSVTQNPAAGDLVGLGTHAVTVTVSDTAGNQTTANVSVSVVDTTAPTIVSAPSTVTVSVSQECQGAVPNVLADTVATDNCTAAGALALSQSPTAGTVVSAGSHTIIVTVSDAAGNSTTHEVTLLVKDNAAPVITSLKVTPNVLSPPNKMVIPVTVCVSASDSCDPAPVSKIISITSNEPTDPSDMVITGDLTANLVAMRNPSGNGRVYTLTVRCTDQSGNSTTGTVTVTVPKGNGGGGGGR